MFKRIATLTVLVAALATSQARADVNKFATTGAQLESGAPESELLLVKGSFNTKTDKLRARIKCAKGCPVKGKMKATCTLGDGFYFDCTGGIRKKCQVVGQLYQRGFIGTYTCGDRTGLLQYGNP